MTRLLDAFEWLFNRLLKFLIAMVAVSIGMFALLIPVNLFLIKLQLGSLWWLNEAVEYALYVGVFIGAPWVLQQGAHVRVDVLVSVLPDNTAGKIEVVLNIIGALICAILCFYGMRATSWEFADGTLPDKNLRIANWYMLVIFSLSFFLLMIEFLLRLRSSRTLIDENSITSNKAAF
ncbi:MAG: TRAP transporter small permease [Hyphomicrobiales bacterium]|nr:TRAP transporter small permease [Hyphomicrobiales bacterium]